MKFLSSAALTALVLSFPMPTVASTWQIDSSHSNAQFAVRHLVVSKVRGSLGTVTGKMILDEADPAKSTLEATVEVTAEAEQQWVDTCIQKARQTGDFLENCTPGYYNNEGKPGDRSAQDGFYGGGSVEFFRVLTQWRDSGELEGLEID